MKTFSWALATSAILSSLLPVSAVTAGDSDELYSDWTKAFLHRNGSEAWYDLTVDGPEKDKGWTAAKDIIVATDQFFRNGDEETRDLVQDLARFWLKGRTRAGFAGDCWNDDIAWFSLMLIHAYQTTGNSSYLHPAMYGNDLVWERGWDTKYNDGGIWEKQPSCDDKPQKQALSTDPNALAACYIYQSTHNSTYFDRCKAGYEWTRKTLFNSTSGAVLRSIRPDGTIGKNIAITDGGLWIDLANVLWLITGDHKYYADAKLSTNYWFHTRAQGGVVLTERKAQGEAAAPLARGVGSFMRDNQLWDEYYSQMVNNSDHIVKNKNKKYGVTWGDWLAPTPDPVAEKTDQGYVPVLGYANAVTWLQFTPPFKPTNMTVGIHTISNVESKLLLTSSGPYNKTTPVSLESTSKSTQTQRWRLSTNGWTSDASYNLVSLHTWQQLTAIKDEVGQRRAMRRKEQRWCVDKVGSNEYSIINKDTGLALDGGKKGDSKLTLTKYTGAASQKWSIDTIPAPKA